MTVGNCEHYKELLAAYALTALDAEDARALAAHLESCAECRAEVGAWEEAAALLALDAEPLEPSVQLRERILTGARAEVQGQPSAGNRAATLAPHLSGQSDARLLKFEPPRDVWASLRSFAAIAATLVIGALIISLLVLRQQKRATQRELALLFSEVKQTESQLNHERAVVALLTSPDAHMAKLAGTKMAPDAHAMIAFDKNGHAMFMASGLPAAPQGMAYQLWFIAGAKPMPGKVFQTDATGNATMDAQMPTEALNAATFAVTLEPQAGVAAPTGAMYLLSRG